MTAQTDDATPLLTLAEAGKMRQRLAHALVAEGITTIGQLAALTYRDLTVIPNVGARGRQEIVALIAEYGFPVDRLRPPAGTTRRALLTGAAAVPLAGLGALAGMEAEPVLALARRWHEMEAEHTAAAARLDAAWQAGDTAAYDVIDAEIEAICDRHCELQAEIAATPARSLAGIVAKLRVAAVYLGNDPDRRDAEDDLMLSALHDAERLLAG